MRIFNLLSYLILISFIFGCTQMEKKEILSEQLRAGGQASQIFNTTITKELSCNYLLFLPEGYKEQGKQWPLILFLHGAGERGNDLNKIKIRGLPKVVDNKKDFPFIVVSPQCPEGQQWIDKLDLLINLLGDVTTNYNVDKDRIYLTGYSMGGYGTWALAARYSERFAAVVPICGGALPVNAYTLLDIPIWVFHGALDNIVPVRRSKEIVELINRQGGNAKLTIYPEADHDSWTQTYNNPEVYDWLLQHRISDRK